MNLSRGFDGIGARQLVEGRPCQEDQKGKDTWGITVSSHGHSELDLLWVARAIRNVWRREKTETDLQFLKEEFHSSLIKQYRK